MTPCEEWAGPFFASGYGRVQVNGRSRRAHRVVWEATQGPLAAGEHVLHKCDNKRCVNIDHLHVGSHGDNMAEAVERRRFPNQRKEHCPAGHPYDEENTYRRPDGSRACKECVRARARERKRRIATLRKK